MIDEDLAEFLSSKLELKVYHFLFFAIKAREKFCLTCPNMPTTNKVKKSNGRCFLHYLYPAQSTEQVITLPGEEKLLKINWVQILLKNLT